MRLLLVASAPMEFNGMVRLTEARQKQARTGFWTRSGWIQGHEALMAANGAGSNRAAAAVDVLSPSFRPDAVISTGFCGALDPGLRIADVVVGDSVRGQAGSFPCQPLSSAHSHSAGVVFTADHVVQTAAEKRDLRAQGGSVVEMEAVGVADRASALGLPFYCVRVVTDLAGEDMANNFGAALRADGHFATMHIFKHSLRRPAARLPELFRLRANCIRAAQTLGEFFADCQF